MEMLCVLTVNICLITHEYGTRTIEGVLFRHYLFPVGIMNVSKFLPFCGVSGGSLGVCESVLHIVYFYRMNVICA